MGVTETSVVSLLASDFILAPSATGSTAVPPVAAFGSMLQRQLLALVEATAATSGIEPEAASTNFFSRLKEDNSCHTS